MSDLDRRLADALRSVSERHLDEAPHRLGSMQATVIRRVRHRRARLIAITTIVTVLLLTTVAAAIPRLSWNHQEQDTAHGDLVPVTTTIEVGRNPVAIAADDEAIWVALKNGFLVRIDADDPSDVVRTEIAPSLTDITVGGGTVWAAGSSPFDDKDEAAIIRIEQASSGMTNSLVVEVDQQQRSLAATSDSLWAISAYPNPEGGTLNRFPFDEGDGTRSASSEFESAGWSPDGVVADGDTIWTVGTDQGRAIRQLDGGSGDLITEAIIKDLSGRCPPCQPTSPIAVDEGNVVGVWGDLPLFAQVDRSTGRLTRTSYENTNFAVEHGGTQAVAISGGEAWFVLNDDRVGRFDLQTGEVVGEPIEVGSRPVDIAAAGGSVWTINQGDGTVTRIDLVEPPSPPSPQPETPETPNLEQTTTPDRTDSRMPPATPTKDEITVLADGRIVDEELAAVRGERWRLIAWGDDEISCWASQIGEQIGDQSQGFGCSEWNTGEEDEYFLSTLLSPVDGESPAGLLAGEVSLDVSALELRYDDRSIDLEIIRAPASSELPVNYYVAEISVADGATVVALDAGGEILQEEPVCPGGC